MTKYNTLNVNSTQKIRVRNKNVVHIILNLFPNAVDDSNDKTNFSQRLL